MYGELVSATRAPSAAKPWRRSSSTTVGRPRPLA